MSGDIYGLIYKNSLSLDFCLLICGVVFFIFLYIFEKYLWYSTQERYCKKYKGRCTYCTCWSCTKKNFDYNRK